MRAHDGREVSRLALSQETSTERSVELTDEPIPVLEPRCTKRVAVVGAGLFGVTAALALERAGCQVTLFERRDDIMQGATAASMNRVHLGYHYPRSPETISAVRHAERSFRAEYGAAIIDDFRHLYLVAREDSRTSPVAFRSACTQAGLVWVEADSELVRRSSVESVIEVDEGTIDLQMLRRLVWDRLVRSSIDVRLNAPASTVRRSAFDEVVLATYANPFAHLRGQLPRSPRHLRFDLCEVMVAQLPPAYRQLSIVIMDGPFLSIDPLARTGLSLLYHVVHSVHQRQDGHAPVLPPWVVPLLDAGRVQIPERTKFAHVMHDASGFLTGLNGSEYAGSMLSLRVVRTDSADSAARPTEVTRLAPGVVEVFSGKLVNCIDAARAVVAEVVTASC
jgi:hypothetical protein